MPWGRPTSAQQPLQRAAAQLDSPLTWASWLWLLFALGCWAAVVFAGERWLPATMLLYGPRYVLPVPGLFLIPLALWRAPRLLIPISIGIAVLLIPVAGWNVPLGRLTVGHAPAVESVRVVTYNVRGGQSVAPKMLALVRDLEPDVFLAQECQGELMRALRALPDRYTGFDRSVCISSRWPIVRAEGMPNRELVEARRAGYGGAALVTRFVLYTPRGELAVVTLHLETARKGLRTVLSDDPSGAAEQAWGNAIVRDAESRRARDFVDAHGDVPRVVAGDFNIPVESPIFRRHWGDMDNAFSRLGTGFGWTKQEGSWIRIRIDHVLSAGGLRAHDVSLGPDYGSDHLPLVADLHWPR